MDDRSGESKLNVRQRRVARYLRGWLANATPKTNQAALAKLLGWSPAKLNLFLTAKKPAPVAEIIAIATLLRVDEAERDRVVAYARKGDEGSAWWTSYSGDALGGDMTDFVETEAEASKVSNMQMTLVPGLLQTADYSTALVRSWMSEPNEALVDERSKVRQRRQARLTDKGNPLELHALMHESALEQYVGGLDTMLRQLDHLVAMAALPTVKLQLIPKKLIGRETGEFPGFGSAYHLIEFGHGDVAAVYLDNLSEGLYIEAESEAEAYIVNFKRLVTDALDPEATVERIKEIRARRARESEE
ncbi:helix-turn-helix domain-containing protein [Amycolatopsis sp. NPDC058986]|uniref:helix-turn-helix domain-containing protein n=1 Tax=unclassified Amycolatopsis TaxID=2618356 RepID=UPI003671E483